MSAQTARLRTKLAERPLNDEMKSLTSLRTYLEEMCNEVERLEILERAFKEAVLSVLTFSKPDWWTE